MAQVQSGQESEGIKLFGTTITLHRREDHHKKGVSSEDGTDDEEKNKPNKIIPCPRCKSMETKFCYFNNYNVNQPRHFCKGCHRYWTAGGALRNVPVAAGRRKAKTPRRGGTGEFLGGGLYESNSTTVEKFGLDDEGLVLDNESDVATVVHGGFHQLYPSKRRRTSAGGQPC